MIKSMYNCIRERTLNDRVFHYNLVEHIEALRETELERSFPEFKAGQIIYPLSLFNNKEIKKYVYDMCRFDDILEKDIFPGIKFNLGEFIKN